MALELLHCLIQRMREFRLKRRCESSDKVQVFHSFEQFEGFVNSSSLSDPGSFQALSVRNEEVCGTKLCYEIPINIGRFDNLTTFVATRCNLREIPWSIVYLKQLEDLNLSFNCLSLLPNYIVSLPNLKSLNVESNCLRALPTSLLQLTKLTVLNIDNNKQLISPPYLVCRNGLEAIRTSLRNRSNHKNVWENCHAFYVAGAGDWPYSSSVQPLVMLCVYSILTSKQDYLCPTFVPPKLKRYLQKKEKEDQSTIQVAKCAECAGYFSNVHYLEIHECKMTRRAQ